MVQTITFLSLFAGLIAILVGEIRANRKLRMIGLVLCAPAVLVALMIGPLFFMLA